MPDSRPASQTADTSVVPSLLSISRSIRALHGLKLAELGFYNGQDGLLMIADTTGATVSSVADKLSIRPSTVSKMMDRLAAKGLIERIDDSRDARRTLVRITPAGIEAKKQLKQLHVEMELELSKVFSDRGPSMARSLKECAGMLDIHLKRYR